MATLTQERCVACDRHAPRLGDQELAELRPQIPDWTLEDADTVPKLARTFKVRDFASALELADRIGALAEAEQHHPSILIEWGRVTVRWWTHKIKGLHRNDVVMAAKTDEIAASQGDGSSGSLAHRPLGRAVE